MSSTHNCRVQAHGDTARRLRQIFPLFHNFALLWMHLWLTLLQPPRTIDFPMLIYLAGAIEYAPDKGKAWRERLTPFLHSLGWDVYDPAQDEQKNLTDDERLHFRSWKATDLPRFQRTIRKIIDWDMEWITRRADTIVVYWDEYAGRGAGTSGELTAAYRYGKPVYLVTGMPVEKISGWILGCATRVFGSFEELTTFLAAQAAAQPVLEGCVCCNVREETSVAAAQSSA